MKTLGDHIRAARLDRGLFQKDVAKLVGVCTDTVTNWEKNRSGPDLRALPRLIEFLGCDPRQKIESLAGQLLRARQARGLTQKELAAILQIDPCTISEWELGKKVPEGPYLQMVKGFLNA